VVFLSVHLDQALEFFKDNDFVTEDDISSISTSFFRKNFKELLDQNNLTNISGAVEMADGWYYYYYNPNELPRGKNTKEFFIEYFSRNHPAK
jgi:hypothetical protein